MSRKKKSLVGKIGVCDNSALGIPRTGVHYVYIRSLNGNKCDVNVITSLERRWYRFDQDKLKQVRNGNTYPIPKNDSNLPLWSGVTHNPIKGVDVSKIRDIGKISIKQRHHFFIGKYCK